ncbi:MAG: glycosyltransferase [Candidatus Omnitrophica bacterium]|nr:glycosyltransferase [Candidatus Omnitrophota bacterium]
MDSLKNFKPSPDIKINSCTLDKDSKFIRQLNEPLHPSEKIESYDDKTLFYDVFLTPNNSTLILIGPPFLNLQNELGELSIQFNGKVIPLSWENNEGVITIIRADVALVFPINLVRVSFKNSNEEFSFKVPQNIINFKGRTLVTLQKNNKLIWIKDWIHHYLPLVDQIIIYDNGSDNFKEIQSLSNDKVKIVPWVFKYGPPKSFKNDFCQAGALNHCYLKFIESGYLFNFDIDEILIIKTNELNDLLRGVDWVQFDSYMVAREGVVTDDFSFKDFKYREKELRRKSFKYCIRKEAAKYLDVHGVVSSLVDKPHFSKYFFLHYRGITSNWKNYIFKETQAYINDLVRIDFNDREFHNKKFLVLKSKVGMANRIESLMAAICYAHISQRTLVVDWREGMYAEKGRNSFHMLFKSPLVNVSDRLPQTDSVFPSIWVRNLDKTIWDVNSPDLPVVNIDLSKVDYEEHIVVMSDLRFDLEDFGLNAQSILAFWSCENEKELLRKLLVNYLSLRPDITSRVNEFYANNLHGKKIIGVHIRCTDNQKSPRHYIDINKFPSVIQSILKKDPDAFIFLSTDNKRVLGEYQKNYKNIRCTNKFFPDHSEAPIHYRNGTRVDMAKEALIDLYVLARCDYLIYSDRSCFGELALLLSNLDQGNIYNIESMNQKEIQLNALEEKNSGSLWGITTFYNPAQYSNKYTNYKKFRNANKKQGLNLMTIELAFGNNAFELRKEDADILIQLRAGEESVLWQKEALFNIGLKNLPKDCDKIAWLDCDILFKNDLWVKETADLLEKYMVVQPYSYSIHLACNQLDIDHVDSLPIGVKVGQKFHGMAYGIARSGKKVLTRYSEHGHSGYGWAARKEVFNDLGFYDRLILGSADLIMGYAFYGHEQDNEYFKRVLVSDSLRNDRKFWAQQISSRVNGSVSYVSGTILHLWHGDIKNRNYVLRDSILKDHNFSPDTDIKKNQEGIWMWASDKPQMHQAVKEYFYQRKESYLKRIAIVVSSFPKLSESFVLDQITSLIDLGCEVDIYAEKDSKEKVLHKAVSQYDLLRRTTYSHPKEMKVYDFILAHFGVNGVKVLDWKKKGLMRGQLITFFHGYDATSWVLSKGKDYYQDLFRFCDHFVVPCQFFKDLLSKIGCPENKLYVHRLGVDIEKFKFSKRDSLQSPVRVLTIGRLVEKKGIEFGIKAVNELIKSGIHVRYEIVGGGELKESILSLIKSLNLEDNVFLLGERSREEILDILNQSDILIASSITASNGDMESAPIVIKEAMACGVAVVGTKHSGVPEMIRDGISGYLVNEKDFIALAETLKSLIHDNAKRNHLTINARKDVENDWNQKKLDLEFIRVLEKWNNMSNGFPTYSQKLPGELWGITTYFNPSGDKQTKYKNYKKFRESSQRQGLKLLTVELAFGKKPFELKNEDADILLQLRTGKENIFWQRESLVNQGLKRLPKECDKIAWLDADIIFQNENWVKEACRLLEDYYVVQLYSLAINMPKGKDINEMNIDSLEFGKSNNQKRYGFAYGQTLKPPVYGHPSYAWAARRSVFEKEGFSDFNIDGANDIVIKDAFYAPGADGVYKLFPPKLYSAQMSWEKKIHEIVRGSVYYVEGQLFHLWHGEFKNRRYNDRLLILKRNDFDPFQDIKKDEHGLWTWASDKKDMHKALRFLTWLQNEEGNPFVSVVVFFYNLLNRPKGSNISRETIFIKMDQIYLNFLTCCGQSIKKLFPGFYSQLKQYFPDRVAGQKVNNSFQLFDSPLKALILGMLLILTLVTCFLGVYYWNMDLKTSFSLLFIIGIILFQCVSVVMIQKILQVQQDMMNQNKKDKDLYLDQWKKTQEFHKHLMGQMDKDREMFQKQLKQIQSAINQGNKLTQDQIKEMEGKVISHSEMFQGDVKRLETSLLESHVFMQEQVVDSHQALEEQVKNVESQVVGSHQALEEQVKDVASQIAGSYQALEEQVKNVESQVVSSHIAFEEKVKNVESQVVISYRDIQDQVRIVGEKVSGHHNEIQDQTKSLEQKILKYQESIELQIKHESDQSREMFKGQIENVNLMANQRFDHIQLKLEHIKKINAHRKVLIVLNTEYHTETAISLYFSLLRLLHIEPIILRTTKKQDLFGLDAFCKRYKMKYIDSYHSQTDAKAYDSAILVSFYPSVEASKFTLNLDHPVMKDFKDRMLYISHRSNLNVSEDDPSHVLTLSPVGASRGFQQYYQMMNPVSYEGDPLFWKESVLEEKRINILVQGKFNLSNRNIEQLRIILKEITDRNLRIYIVGTSVPKEFHNDERVMIVENASEQDFYRMCWRCHFILPLIDDTIKEGTYLRERFSSSIGISYMFCLPAILHQSIHDLYALPAITYTDTSSCVVAVQAAINMSREDYGQMKKGYGEILEIFQKHNDRVLKDMLDRDAH